MVLAGSPNSVTIGFSFSITFNPGCGVPDTKLESPGSAAPVAACPISCPNIRGREAGRSPASVVTLALASGLITMVLSIDLKQPASHLGPSEGLNGRMVYTVLDSPPKRFLTPFSSSCPFLLSPKELQALPDLYKTTNRSMYQSTSLSSCSRVSLSRMLGMPDPRNQVVAWTRKSGFLAILTSSINSS